MGQKALGFEVIEDQSLTQIARIFSPELSTGGHMEQYRKSLYVFACISKIAQKVGSIDFELFKIVNSKGEMKEITVHPAIDLLYKCNPFQTKAEFWETTIINLKTSGDAFWLKVRDTRGRPVELWNLRPDWVEIVTDPTKFVKEYILRKSDGKTVHFAPEDIVHFKYPDPLSQHLGLSPLRPAQIRIQTEDYATRYNRDFFLNSARPDAVIKNSKKNLDAEQKEDIREGWSVRHKGLKNAHNVAVLDGGLEYQQISLNQKDMDYIEGIKATRDDILVALQVPKVILSIVDDVNRANAETGMAIFLGETVAPEMKRMVEKINEELIIPDFGDDLELDFVDPTPKNREKELQENREGIQYGYMLVNEVREREGLVPIKGGWTAYRPISDVPVGGLAGKEVSKGLVEVQVGGSNEQRAFEKSRPEKIRMTRFHGRSVLKMKLDLAEEMKKLVSSGINKVNAAKKAKKVLKKKSTWKPLITGDTRKIYGDMIAKKVDKTVDQLKDESDKFFAEQGARVMKQLKKKVKTQKAISVSDILNESKEAELTAEFIAPFIEQYLTESAKEALNLIAPQEEFDLTAALRRTIKKRASVMGEEVTTSTAEKLASALSQGLEAGEGIAALSARVADVYEEFSTYRSERIARTEATMANNKGTLEGFRQSNVATGKEWIATGDGATRESHASIDGDIVGLDDEFGNGLKFPGDPSGDSEEVINCRCAMGPAFLEE